MNECITEVRNCRCAAAATAATAAAACCGLDFWQFRRRHHGVGLLEDLAAFRLVVERTVVRFRVAMRRTEVTAAPATRDCSFVFDSISESTVDTFEVPDNLW